MKKFFKKVSAFVFHPYVVIFVGVFGLLLFSVGLGNLNGSGRLDDISFGVGFCLCWYIHIIASGIDELAEMSKKKSTPDEK